MIFRFDDYESSIREQSPVLYPDSVTLREIGRQELAGWVAGEGAIWGAEDHTTEGGYRGDPKPDDNTEGETIMAPSPDGSLPPEGEVIGDEDLRKIDRKVGHDAVNHTVDLALAA